jgi:hypothetical protein
MPIETGPRENGVTLELDYIENDASNPQTPD